MRHSWAIWAVSAAVSAGVHAGVISALARISIEGPKDEARSEVVLAGGSIAAVAAAADTAREATPVDTAELGQVLPSAAEAEDVPAAADQGRLAGEASDAQAGSSQAGAAPSPEEVDTAVPAASGGEAPAGSAETAASLPAGGDLPEANEPGAVAIAPPADAPATAAAGDGAAAAPAAPAEAGGEAGSVLPSAPESAATLPEGTKTASIVTAAPEVMSQAERIDRFLKSYGGGGCLYALPSALDAPRPAFGGFGAERGVLDFAAAFRKAVGVEPELAIRTVMEPQCPAVEFLRDVAALRPRSVEVVLDSGQVANGAMVTGHLEGDPGGEVRLLVVGDDGAVSDISADFHRMGGGNFFASPLLVNDAGRARNQILVALVSRTPLTIAASHVAGEAKGLFAEVARQAGAPGASVAIGFNSFRVE